MNVTNRAEKGAPRPAVCVVGPGWRFTSGISYYTCRLVNAFADHHRVSVIQLRQLLPKCFYPGKARVGQPRAAMTFREGVPVFNGIDWWWGFSLFRALFFMRANRPAVLVLEWWTATTLHTYVALAIAARLIDARVVLELHESQDPGEAGFALMRWYGKHGLGLLLRIADGCVLHSKSDQRLFDESYGSVDIRVAIAPHGPFDQYSASTGASVNQIAIDVVRQAPRPAVANLLFFGLIRPYKGLEDLLTVYNALTEEEVTGLWLTVVGETWDGCTAAGSPHRDKPPPRPDHLCQRVRSR